MNVLRYYTVILLVGLGIAGFWLDVPWLGFSSFWFILIFDAIFPRDTKFHDVGKGFGQKLVKLMMYIHLFIMMPTLYVSFFMYLLDGYGSGNLTILSAFGAVVSVAWLNVVPNLSVIHDFAHGGNRFERFMGHIYSMFLLNMGRLIAHNHGHHLFIATSEDGDYAPRGRNIYPYVIRAHFQTWVTTYKVDMKKLKGKGILTFLLKSKTSLILVTTLLLHGTIFYFAGPLVGATFLLALFFSAIFVEGLGFFQHYGLIRVSGARVGIRHAWNHLNPAIRVSALEITNHSGHHWKRPSRPFYLLEPIADAPQMPNPILCLLLALLAPPLWEKLIAKPRLKHWDLNFATPEERELAREANKAAGWSDWTQEDVFAASEVNA